jgi:type II secretory pathway pseudopilin PulG
MLISKPKFEYQVGHACQKNKARQSGQTLIETVVAVFILVMGIVAALGLAVYSLNASSNVTKQIVGIGLAREGVEAVKNMRDSNWLIGSLSSTCYDFSLNQSNLPCYTDWLGPNGSSGARNGYSIDPGNGNNAQKCYRIEMNTDSKKDSWNYKSDDCSTGNWGLDIDNSLSG